MTIVLIPMEPEGKNFDILTTQVYINVPSMDFEFNGEVTFDGHQSMMWSTMLSDDGRYYFAGSKKVAVPMSTETAYTYKG